MKNTLIAFSVSLLLLLLGCGQKQSAQDALIDCKTKFYARAGTQDDFTAPLSYLKDKGEACQACMNEKGYKHVKNFDIIDESGDQWIALLEPYKLATKVPSAMTPEEKEYVSRAREKANERALALISCVPRIWQP